MFHYSVTASYFERNFPSDNFVITNLTVLAFNRRRAIRKAFRALKILRLARGIMVHHAKRIKE